MTGDRFLSYGGSTNTSQRILEGQEGQICIAEVWGDRMMVLSKESDPLSDDRRRLPRRSSAWIRVTTSSRLMVTTRNKINMP